MPLAELIFPWPWKVVDQNKWPPTQFKIQAANGDLIAAFNGPNAQTKCNIILELGAVRQNYLRLQQELNQLKPKQKQCDVQAIKNLGT